MLTVGNSVSNLWITCGELVENVTVTPGVIVTFGGEMDPDVKTLIIATLYYTCGLIGGYYVWGLP